MDILKPFLLIAFGLVVIAISGCATKTVQTVEKVELDSIQTIELGETISITTNKEVFVKDTGVFYLRMLVTDVNAERIQGDFVPTYGEGDQSLSGTAVEINLEDIGKIVISTSEREIDWAKTRSMHDPHIDEASFWTSQPGKLLILVLLVLVL